MTDRRSRADRAEEIYESLYGQRRSLERRRQDFERGREPRGTEREVGGGLVERERRERSELALKMLRGPVSELRDPEWCLPYEDYDFNEDYDD